MRTMTLNEVVEDYLDEPTKTGKDKSETAHRRLGEMVANWGEDKPITDISDKDVRLFFRRQKKRVDPRSDRVISGATYNTYVVYYNAMMNHARKELKQIQYFPEATCVAEEEKTDFLEYEEFERLLEELDPLRRDIASICVLTGLRKSNVTNLRWSQVSKCGEFIRIDGNEMKNGSPIEVPLINKCRDIISYRRKFNKALLERYPYLNKKLEYVFVQKSGDVKLNGQPLKEVCNRTWRNAVERAGLPKGTRVHGLRHTFATWHRRAGTDDRQVRELAGWRSAKPIERFSHILAPELVLAASNLENIIGKGP